MKKTKLSVKSVLTPSLQFPEKKKVCNAPVSDFDMAVTCIISNPAIDRIERVMVELMYINALRVSELLRIKGTDLLANNTFVINASKGSANRIGFLGNTADYMSNFAGQEFYIFASYSRQFIYYRFKRLGINFQVFDNLNSAVTHSFRHQAITNINSSTSNDEITKQVIGHKSVKSTKHYLNHKLKS